MNVTPHNSFHDSFLLSFCRRTEAESFHYLPRQSAPLRVPWTTRVMHASFTITRGKDPPARSSRGMAMSSSPTPNATAERSLPPPPPPLPAPPIVLILLPPLLPAPAPAFLDEAGRDDDGG